MADLGIVGDSFSGDSDPLAESTPEIGSEDSSTPEAPLQEAEDSSIEEPQQPQLIEGTPFKDQQALVDGYKNIQRYASQKDQALKQVEQQLQIAVQQLEKFMAQRNAPAQPTEPQGEELWTEFSKDPTAVIRRIAKSSFEQDFKEKYGKDFDGMREQFSRIQQESTVQSFISQNPGFTSEDEDAMVVILNQHPELQGMQNGLQLAYDQVLAGRYRQSMSKDSFKNAVAGAKAVAGLGGKKSSIPAQAKTDDAFDDVLKVDKEERALYKYGR